MKSNTTFKNKMYVPRETPVLPKNRSTIFATERHLEQQAKGFDLAQRRHLDGIRANNSVNFYFDSPNVKSLFMTINAKGGNKFDIYATGGNKQRSTIFSNTTLLQHNTKFIPTQSKKHFKQDYKTQGLGAKATFQPESSSPAYVKSNFSRVVKEPKRNLCSQNNHLFETTMPQYLQFTDPLRKNEVKTQGKRLEGRSERVNTENSETYDNYSFLKTCNAASNSLNRSPSSNLYDFGSRSKTLRATMMMESGMKLPKNAKTMGRSVSTAHIQASSVTKQFLNSHVTPQTTKSSSVKKGAFSSFKK